MYEDICYFVPACEMNMYVHDAPSLPPVLRR